MVVETSVHSPFSHMTRLPALQTFTEFNPVRWAFFHLSLCTIHSLLPNPWNKLLLEKLTLAQLLNKFPTLYGTRKFIVVSARARYGFLSLATSLLCSSLRLRLPSDFVMKILYVILISLTRAACDTRLIVHRLDIRTIFVVDFKP
jgi:hypothetical protein